MSCALASPPPPCSYCVSNDTLMASSEAGPSGLTKAFDDSSVPLAGLKSFLSGNFEGDRAGKGG